MFKLATEFTIFFSSTMSRIIIKYQHLGKFETFWMAHYIIKHCSFERPVLSVVVRTKLVTNRTLCHFVLINIFTLAKINVYTCSIFNSPSIVILIVLDGCYGLLWPFYLLFLWVCCAWFKQYRQKCLLVKMSKKITWIFRFRFGFPGDDIKIDFWHRLHPSPICCLQKQSW